MLVDARDWTSGCHLAGRRGGRQRWPTNAEA